MNSRLALFILRISLGIVFLIFGIGKFHNDIWAQTMRNMDFFQKLPWDVNISILLVGTVETATGLCLILGLLSRIAAAAAVLMLISILFMFNFQEIRDLGLLGAASCLVIMPELSWGIDWLVRIKKQRAKI